MKRLIASVGICLMLGACSVGMAMSGKENPDLSVVKTGASRGEVELQLGSPVKTALLDGGTKADVYEYEIGNAPSAGRAIGHGVMDVLTLGLWEVVGTPIEGFQGDKFHLTVFYDKNDKVTAVKTRKAPSTTAETNSDENSGSYTVAAAPAATKTTAPDSASRKFATESERDAWYAEAKNSVEQKYGRLIATQRKKRYALTCDRSEKQAASQPCRDVALQLRLLLDAKGKELASLKREHELTIIPRGEPAQSAKVEARKSRGEIQRRWRDRIEAVKNEGPYKDCEINVDMSSGDPASISDCEERGDKIKLLRKQMKRDLTS